MLAAVMLSIIMASVVAPKKSRLTNNVEGQPDRGRSMPVPGIGGCQKIFLFVSYSLSLIVPELADLTEIEIFRFFLFQVKDQALI